MNYLSRIDGQSGKAALDALIQKQGPLADQQDVPADLAEADIGRVPNLLVDLWRAHGVGGLRDRTMWLPMPGTLDAAAEQLFNGDPDLGGDTLIVAYGAMGNLICWNVRHGVVLVDLLGGAVQAPGLMAPDTRKEAGAEFLEVFEELHPFFFDRVDSNNEPMLDWVRAKHPALDLDEVYGAFRASRMDRSLSVENVQIVEIASFIEGVMQHQAFMLHDYVGQRHNIRVIGEQR